MTGAPLAYYFGDDGYGVERAVDARAEQLRAAHGDVDRWRVRADATTPATIAERLGTGPLFGGGVLAIVVDPRLHMGSKEGREALLGALGAIAPGNGLVFVDAGDASKSSAAHKALAAAVREAGGEVREFPAPKEGGLAHWIELRAAERGLRLGPGAAKELAQRVGGFVHEGDVDRRGQGELAVGELDKLALYRPGAAITVDDVRALVAEAVPGSTWAFLDAVGARRIGRATQVLERLLDATPDLVILAQLHRRIRDLIEVADHLAAGATPGSLVRTLGLKPFRAEKLVEQAHAWTQPELDAALEELVELDATVRGAPGTPGRDANRRLAWTMWVAQRAPATAAAAPAAAASATGGRRGA